MLVREIKIFQKILISFLSFYTITIILTFINGYSIYAFSQNKSKSTDHNRDILLQMADFEADTGNYTEARRLYKKLWLKRYDDIRARLGFANLLMKENRLDEARTEYLKILFLNPKQEDTLSGLAQIYFFEGKYNDTLEILDRVFQINTDNESGRIIQAKTFIKIHQQNKSWEILSDLISRYRKNNIFVAEFIKLLLHTGNNDKAIEVINRISPIQENAVILRILSSITLERNNHTESAKQLKQVIFHSIENYSGLLDQIVELLIEFHKFEYADMLVSRCLKQNPFDVKLQILLCTITFESGDEVRCRKLTENFLEQEPGNDVLQKLLGNCFFKQKNYGKSINIYNSLLTTEPDNPDLILQQARSLWNSGNIGKSIEYYNKFSHTTVYRKFLETLQFVRSKLPAYNEAGIFIQDLLENAKRNRINHEHVVRIISLLDRNRFFQFYVAAAEIELKGSSEIVKKALLELKALDTLQHGNMVGAASILKELIKTSPFNRFAKELYSNLTDKKDDRILKKKQKSSNRQDREKW